jgi:hypothetical protein
MRKLDHKLGEKKTLYSVLADEYFLPPRESRGVTKAYLDKVKDGMVFKVETLTLNRFLAELRPSHLKRSVYTCKFEAYSKIDKLLVEREALRLGFEEGQIPDGTWLYKVARYLDQANLCGLFEVALHPAGEGQTDSEWLYRAQRQAEKVLLTETGLGKRPEIKTCLTDLQQTYKRLISRQAELANLTIYGKLLEKQVETDRESMERQLASTSLVVYQAGKKVSVEEALQSRDDEKQGVHDTLRLVYATDCILDRSQAMGKIAGRFS